MVQSHWDSISSLNSFEMFLKSTCAIYLIKILRGHDTMFCVHHLGIFSLGFELTRQCSEKYIMARINDASPIRVWTNKWLFTHLFFNDMHGESSRMISKRYLNCRCISPLFIFSRLLPMTDSKRWRVVSIKCAIERRQEILLSYRFPPQSEPISRKWYEWDAPCFFLKKTDRRAFSGVSTRGRLVEGLKGVTEKSRLASYG